MLPLLELAGDGEEHAVKDARSPLAARFDLTDEERAELLPSGQQAIFTNRVAWAKVYLERAGLLSKPKRGFLKITERGSQVLQDPPDEIDTAFLSQFPEFVEFRKVCRDGRTTTAPAQDDATPEEALDDAYERIREDLAMQLLEQVKSLSPLSFERLVIDVMLKMGYGGSRSEAGTMTRAAGDEGIDGVINEDRLGLDAIYLQAKRWSDQTVGRPEIQKFVGALHGKRARKGVFITTSSFSPDAAEYVNHTDPKVVLVDGMRLAQLMIDYNVGVSVTQVYELKRLDLDYFADE